VGESAAAFGQLLSQWRRLRGKSQLDLAVDAAVSPRHVSFVEQWDLLRTNTAANAFFAYLMGGARPEGRPNVLRLMFDERYLKPCVENWDEVAGNLVQRAHREAVGGTPNEALKRVLKEVLAYPGVPERFASLDPSANVAPFVPVAFRRGDLAFRYFSLVTTLGTPQDVTLQELRVESFLPADAETESAAARLPSAGITRSQAGSAARGSP
jgi:MmyB-like transcription regulator ligand binding domain